MTGATSSSRKKTRSTLKESPSPPSPSDSVFQSSSSFAPIENGKEHSQSYLQALEQVKEFRRLVQEELTYIAESTSRATKSSKSGNPYETPRKKLLQAQVELARMDWMEQKPIAELIYTSLHFGTDTAGKAAFDARPEMQEVQHILDLYEDLRHNLSIKARKRSKVKDAFQLLFILAYTCLAIPLFTLVLLFAPLNAILVNTFKLKNHFQPVDLIQKLYARGFLFLSGIKVQWYGMEHVNYDESAIGMFSHASNLDPVIVASGPLAFKWIGKKSLFKIPVIGWLLSGLEHIPIERENREKAVASLKRAAEIVLKHKRCIAISPEGTRSKSGRISDFKKGAFHTAMEVGAPIQPLLIEGAYDLWPSGSIFASPGLVSVTFLKPLKIGEKDTYNTLASKVRRAFYEQLLKSAQNQIREQSTPGAKKEKGKEFVNYGVHTLWVPISYAVLFLLYSAVKLLI